MSSIKGIDKAWGFLIVVLSCLPLGCIDPVAPEFDYEAGIVYVDAFVSGIAGGSYAIITESLVEGDDYDNVPVSDATVRFRNVTLGEEILLVESEGVYLPEQEIAVPEGEIWQMVIDFPDGRRYESELETVVAQVPIAAINGSYDPELIFSDTEETFVPGHRVTIDIEDPADESNYYYWTSRTFETLDICATCERSILRNGECEPNPIGGNRQPIYDYACDTDCWTIRYGTDVRIFSDEFTDGMQINALPVADVLLYTKENILVEIQQFCLSAPAYRYYQILNDLVDNVGNINAPPPAALLGNMYNVNDPNESVLGRFTAANPTVATIAFERSDIEEETLEETGRIPSFEACNEVCPQLVCDGGPQPDPPCFPVTQTTCDISDTRTNIRPVGWIF